MFKNPRERVRGLVLNMQLVKEVHSGSRFLFKNIIHFYNVRTLTICLCYLVEDWYILLKAPKKDLFWFEKSGHTVFNSEPEKLQKVIIEKILPETF